MNPFQRILWTGRQTVQAERKYGTSFEGIIHCHLNGEVLYADFYSDAWSYEGWSMIVEQVEALKAHCRQQEKEIDRSRRHADRLLQAVRPQRSLLPRCAFGEFEGLMYELFKFNVIR